MLNNRVVLISVGVHKHYKIKKPFEKFVSFAIIHVRQGMYITGKFSSSWSLMSTLIFSDSKYSANVKKFLPQVFAQKETECCQMFCSLAKGEFCLLLETFFSQKNRWKKQRIEDWRKLHTEAFESDLQRCSWWMTILFCGLWSVLYTEERNGSWCYAEKTFNEL